MKKSSLFLVWISLAIPCTAETIIIDANGTGDYQTIQAAINDANDGDIIELQPGTYKGDGNRDIDFLGRAITVQSESGAESCIIDCERAGRGFYFHSGEDGNSVVKGFTIINGQASNGGGIYCAESSPTVSHCIININNADDYGGGIYCVGSSPAISNCIISFNTANNNDGGGIYCSESSPSITNCTVTANLTNGDGGGLRCAGVSNPTISNCIFWGDLPDEISLEEVSSASVTYCDVQGGWPGIGNIDAGPCFVDSYFVELEYFGLISYWKFDEGSGATAYDSAGNYDGTIYGAQWTTGRIGGGLSFDGDDGVYVEGSSGADSPLNIYNSDVTISTWVKLSGSGGTIVARAKPYYITYILRASSTTACISVFDSGHHYDICSDAILNQDTWYHIFGVFDRASNTGYLYVDGILEADGSMPDAPPGNDGITKIGCRNNVYDYPFNGTIDEVMIFNSALSAEEIQLLYCNPLSSYRNYYLGPNSPCFDAGDPNYVQGPNETDLGGNPRVIGDVIDMGAYECSPVIGLRPFEINFRVNKPGDPNPSDRILSICNVGVSTLYWEVIEDCNWLEVTPVSGESSGEIDDVYIMVDISGLVVGSYNCELLISDPNAENNPQRVTVTLELDDFDGQLHVPSEYETIQAAIDLAEDGDTVIVAQGTYTGDGDRDLDFGGKAITVRGSNPDDPDIVAATIINCNGTVAEPYRGFIFNSGEGPNSIVAGLTVINGYAPDEQFITAMVGGAIFCIDSSPTITKCRLKDNRAEFGGGIFSWSSNPAIDHCIIADNSANENGGGIYIAGTIGPIITHCTIVGNSADTSGGGICCWEGNPAVTHCILWDNTALSSFPEIAGTATVSYCDVEGGALGTGNIDADPCFVDVENGDYHLLYDSSCVDAGDPNYSSAPGETDIDGDLRVIDGRVDIGADEFYPGCFPPAHPDYSEWFNVGKPDCWCYPRQCHGDADGFWEGGSKLGTFYVGFNDLNVLVSAWKVLEPAVPPTPSGPGITLRGACADFDHAKEGNTKIGFFRVGFNDLNIMVANWKILEPSPNPHIPSGPGVPPDCLDVP